MWHGRILWSRSQVLVVARSSFCIYQEYIQELQWHGIQTDPRRGLRARFAYKAHGSHIGREGCDQEGTKRSLAMKHQCEIRRQPWKGGSGRRQHPRQRARWRHSQSRVDGRKREGKNHRRVRWRRQSRCFLERWRRRWFSIHESGRGRTKRKLEALADGGRGITVPASRGGFSPIGPNPTQSSGEAPNLCSTVGSSTGDICVW